MKFFNLKHSLLAVMALVSFSASAQTKSATPKKWITVSGKFQFLHPEEYKQFNKVWIGKGNGHDFKFFDSANVKPDGTYSLKVDATVPAILRIDLMKENMIMFFSDADVVINYRGADTAAMKIKNPPYAFIESKSMNNKIINMINHLSYMGYQESIFVYNEDYFANEHKKTDSAWATYLKEKDRMAMFNQNESERMNTLIRNYAEEPGVLAAIMSTNWQKKPEQTAAIIDKLIKKYPWFTDAKQLKKDIETYLVRTKMLENGKPAPLFTYPDTKGNKVSLASYKGKYVLVDFWASWCGPCRQSIPQVKELYTKYKDKGFDVLSVSIDNDKKAWLKAVEEEDMPWAQVLTPNIKQTQIDYMFNGVPTLYLIDDKGNIVDKFLGFGEETAARLREILDNI